MMLNIFIVELNLCLIPITWFVQIAVLGGSLLGKVLSEKVLKVK